VTIKPLDSYSSFASNHPFLGPQIDQHAERLKDMKWGEWDYSGADGAYAAGLPKPLAMIGTVIGSLSKLTWEDYSEAIAAGDPTKKDFLEDPRYFPCGW
jgi:hypothetical protein